MACLLGLLSACSGNPSAGAGPADPPPVPVKIAVARAAMLKDSTEYVATLKSRDEIWLRLDVLSGIPHNLRGFVVERLM